MQPEPQKYGFIWFLTPQKVQNMVKYGVLGQKGRLYGKYGKYGKIWSCGNPELCIPQKAYRDILHYNIMYARCAYCYSK